MSAIMSVSETGIDDKLLLKRARLVNDLCTGAKNKEGILDRLLPSAKKVCSFVVVLSRLEGKTLSWLRLSARKSSCAEVLKRVPGTVDSKLSRKSTKASAGLWENISRDSVDN